jgi:hypothetical protein
VAFYYALKVVIKVPKLGASIAIDRLEKAQEVTKTLHEMVIDERIPLHIREEYMDKVNEILERK